MSLKPSPKSPPKTIQCPNCQATGEESEFPMAIRSRPGLSDVGWKCTNCATEFGFEVLNWPGQILGEDFALLYVRAGGVEQGDLHYDLCIAAATDEPFVKNKTTGKRYLLRWPEILKLAREAGIDSP